MQFSFLTLALPLLFSCMGVSAFYFYVGSLFYPSALIQREKKKKDRKRKEDGEDVKERKGRIKPGTLVTTGNPRRCDAYYSFI